MGLGRLADSAHIRSFAPDARCGLIPGLPDRFGLCGVGVEGGDVCDLTVSAPLGRRDDHVMMIANQFHEFFVA